MLPSPCINVCQMEAARGLCVGCWRSLDEIAGWSGADDAARATILAAVARRRQEQAASEPGWPKTMNSEEDLYPCVGICLADPDSGYCLGCGRPPLAPPGIVAEVCQTVVEPQTHGADPDTPE